MPRRLLILALLASCAAPASLSAGKIEAVKGKRYTLTRRHGPWMLMVASFHPVREGFRTDDGLTPEQAADELVYELRSRGLPAYAWEVDSQVEHIESMGRDGTPQNRVFAALRGGVCVLAGNYPSASDERATKALAAVKNFQPKVLAPRAADRRGRQISSTGGVFRLTPGRSSGPLAGAFLTINPLLTPAEARAMGRKRDPLLAKLNGGQHWALHTAPGAHTVVVASFRGKSYVQVPGQENPAAAKAFDAGLTLDRAGEEARRLCHVLRERKVEAYVWHEQSRSIVTIGSFDAADHPDVRRLVREYGSRTEPHPQTGVPTLTAYHVTVPQHPRAAEQIEHQWVFDVTPYAMPVPKL